LIGNILFERSLAILNQPQANRTNIANNHFTREHFSADISTPATFCHDLGHVPRSEYPH
jgi:hypothetical protein